CECRVDAIEVAARYRVTQDELMTTPGMVRAGPYARSRGFECAAEIRHGKGRHLRSNTEFGSGVVERPHRLAHQAQKGRLGPGLAALIAMGVEPTEGAEENLSSDAEVATELDEFGHLLQFVR